MHPVLIQIGSFKLPTYGVVLSLSIMLGILLSMRRAKREGIDKEHFLMAVLLGVTGIVVMSKVMHILVTWDWYAENPARLLDFRRGHVYYGGFIGGLGFPFIYTRIVKERYLPIFDIWMTYTGLGLAVHRALGCTAAGCCHGRPTDLPWGIVFPAAAPAAKVWGQVPVHPTQLYEALLGLVIFGALLAWRKYGRKVYGELFTLELIIYSSGRFFIEYYRGDAKRGIYGVLSTSQWISLGMLALAGVLVVYLLRERRLLKAAGLTTQIKPLVVELPARRRTSSGRPGATAAGRKKSPRPPVKSKSGKARGDKNSSPRGKK